jgi:hypothetical protein
VREADEERETKQWKTNQAIRYMKASLFKVGVGELIGYVCFSFLDVVGGV